jgi:tartrate-resistant acid phosphatase type 5
MAAGVKRRVLLAVLLLAALAVALWVSIQVRPGEEDSERNEASPSFGESAVRNARPAPPLEELRFAEGGPALSFFALGDTGWGGAVLAANAAAMERSAEARPVDLVLLLGDNFYRSGVKSVEDELWRTRFEEAFVGAKLQVPFYAVLGNHDHYGDCDAQIEYSARSARWRMPARWYTFTKELRGGGEAQFFALDTQPIKNGWFKDRGQRRWLEEELSRSKARWKIVFGHHPVLSNGAHGPTEGFDEVLAPLFGRYGVDLYFSGHDHDLQIVRSAAGWLQIVSGGGSSTRDTSYGEGSLFAAGSPGYAWVGIGTKEMWIEIATAAGGPLFRFKVEKP